MRKAAAHLVSSIFTVYVRLYLCSPPKKKKLKQGVTRYWCMDNLVMHLCANLIMRIRSGLLSSILLSIWTLKSHSNLTSLFSFSITVPVWWSYHFSVWMRLYFLHKAQSFKLSTLVYRFWCFFGLLLSISLLLLFIYLFKVLKSY